MRKLSNALKVFTLLLLSLQCEAQKFEWVNLFGGKYDQIPVAMNVDSVGNQYATFYFDIQMKFDTFTVNQGGRNKGLVVKQNKEGKLLWSKIISSVKSTEDAIPYGSLFNRKGNLLVFIEAEYDIKIGQDTIKKKGKNNSVIFMIEFNTSGKIVNSVQLIEGVGDIFGSNLSRQFTSDKYDNIYLSFDFKGQLTAYDKSGARTIGQGRYEDGGAYIIKFSNSGQKFEWCALLPPSAGITINNLKADIHGNVYAATERFHQSSSFPFIFMGKSIGYTKNYITGHVFIWDKNGKEKNWFSIESSGNKSRFIDLAVHDSNSLFISGVYLGDTARFDKLTKKNRKYGCYYFMALYHADGKLQWVKTEDTTYNGIFGQTANAFSTILTHCTSMTNYKDTFIYLSFNMPERYNYPIVFDGKKYLPIPKSYGINMKVGAKGNIIWACRTYNPFSAMGTDDDDNLYFQSVWRVDSLRFGNSKYYPIDNFDSYIGKTFDYAIYRGNVKAGPYCAGDSIHIPYTKTGEYADNNIFLAEISDEWGNFSGNEQVIGSIKSKTDGTISGIIPMLKVSSGNYRIRIRSTSPPTQSFYKKDTLRLLVYSREKANPGPAQWICRGDTLQLNTYGGTKWKWSPKYRMDDSTIRQPLVWPAMNVTYKIIIADSSGCVGPDTAYKQVYIRDDLKAILAFTDASVCKNATLKIPVHFTGGDSNYHWKSYNILSPKSWSFIGQGQFKQNDTLYYYTNLDSSKKSEKLALIVWDGCTSKHDTAYLNINLRKPYISKKLSDTLVCDGAQLNLTATSNAPSGTYYWQWKDMGSNKVLSNFDFLKLKVNQTYKIKLSLISSCHVDSSEFTIKVKLPLKTNIYTGIVSLNDTTLCFGQSLKLNATGKFSDSTGYEFKWYLDKKLVAGSNHFTLNTGSNFVQGGEKKTLKLILNDNCSMGDDSISKIITVIPAPKADFSYGKACTATPVQFTFTGSKPDAPFTTTFKWNLNNEATSTSENPSHKFAAAGTSTINLRLNSSNGCTDNITKTINVNPNSKADFSATDVCESDSVVFINKSKDAMGYTWKFGDGQTISTNPGILTQKHKYQITTSTTFNVTLVAIGSGGCSDSLVNAVTINENPKSDFTYTPGGAGKMDFNATQTVAKNYRWLFGNGDSAKVTNPNYSYTYKKTSNYNVCLKVINTAGCQSETCKQIQITGGISPMARPSGFKIYPNPNTGNFTLEIENPSDDVSIEIYDILGELVERVERVEKVTTLDLNLSDGIYLIKVKNGKVVWNQKIVVNN